jgi:hypothetical protein
MMRPTNPESRIKIALLATTLLVVSATTQVCRAEIISIDPATGVTASSAIGAPFDRQDDFIVDGSGLFGGQHTPAVQPNMWLSTGNGFGGIDPDPSVTFDLGAVYTITSFHVWNYNEAPPNLTGRGVNSVSVEFGTTAALGGTVAGITNFAQANGLNTYAGEEFNTFAPFSARFIKFDINSNHGDGSTFYGLSEVQFNGNASGLVVSPDNFVTSASQGAEVGTLSTPSGDAGDTFTYTLIAGTGDTDNSKFQVVGDELQIGLHDFSGAVEGEEFSVRVLSTGAPSGTTVEAALTLSAVADSDGDGLLDAWEELWAGVGNLGVLSGLVDANADDDSLTDLDEFNLRAQFPNLDPTKGDTDGDTLKDGEEIAGAGDRPPTDPTNPDSDGDGLTDEVETNTGVDNGPTDTGSNPTLVDTDGDGHDDPVEIAKGSDPSDSDSVPPVDPSDVIPVLSVTPSTEIEGGFDRRAIYLVDGSGLVDGGHDGIPDGSMWLSMGTCCGGTEDLDPFVIFDLGEVYSITSFQVWNYNESTGGNLTERGVNEVTIEYGDTEALGSTVPGITNFAQAPEPVTTTYAGEVFDSFAPFSARYIKFDINSSHGGDNAFYGLSEVQFKGTLGPLRKMQLDIDLVGGELEIKWPSQFGKLYNLRSSIDPANDGAPGTWQIFRLHQEIEATPDLNTLIIPLPADTTRLFVIEEFPKPPTTIRAEDFETGAAGWTMGSEGTEGTVWEIGIPSGFVGPLEAFGGQSCAGTNLGGDYLPGADVWLRSPAIDLTGVGGATLSFAQYRDIDDIISVNFATVSVVNAADNSFLAEIATGINGFPIRWEEESFPVPASVLGLNVKFEFRLITDGIAEAFFGGYYIDDFLLTVP